jgi:hypothetical protein
MGGCTVRLGGRAALENPYLIGLLQEAAGLLARLQNVQPIVIRPASGARVGAYCYIRVEDFSSA